MTPNQRIVEAISTTIMDEARKLAKSYNPVWHTPDEIPQDESKLYLVKMEGDIPCFLNPINGKWMNKVQKWMEIPD